MSTNILKNPKVIHTECHEDIRIDMNKLRSVTAPLFCEKLWINK